MFTGQHAWLLLCHVTSRGMRESKKIKKKSRNARFVFFCLSVELLDFLYFSGISLIVCRRQSFLTVLTRPPILLSWKADFSLLQQLLCFLLVCIRMNNTQCFSSLCTVCQYSVPRPISFSVRVSVGPLLFSIVFFFSIDSVRATVCILKSCNSLGKSLLSQIERLNRFAFTKIMFQIRVGYDGIGSWVRIHLTCALLKEKKESPARNKSE